MMTTNVWLNQEWSDYKLKWDPSEYGGIQDINVPAEQIWLPDIVLYNSAEGYFAVSIMTKAKVRYDGHVTWNPPAIFRSSCQIDITYFPFDSQNCHLKFGSWTFGTKIDLRHINDTEIIERGTDLSEYYQNVEWDIMQASARRNVITYTCCPNDFYPDVTFNFTLRRKPLFYTVNLILPCIGITILSFLVFYLPSDSGEKVTLTISILVSLIFFLSVLIETIPSTSLAMPLLGKYLVFTMILITLSVCATVCVLNIHFRTPSTHSMPSWVKRWCIDILPRYLFMNVPQYQSAQSSVLPEQLVYVYNQAYAKAPPQPPLPPTAAPQSAQQPPLAQANKSSAGTSHSQTANHLSALNHPPGDAAMHQLDPRSLQQQVDPNLRPLNNSPASLFLPYLQSEAARRLKLQRSRSSERDRSTSDGNQNTTSHLINNNNNDCDKHEWASKMTTPNTGSQRRNSETHGENSAATKRSTASKQMKAKRSSRRKSVRGEQTKGSWLSHLFRSSKRNNKVSGVAEDYEAARGVSRSEDRSKRGGRQVVLPRQDTSSSVEYDYQHHNHFQARASICSNNMWRVGPSRRCSTAVPVNYPTYYQPLVHLVQRPPPQQQPAEQQQPLTTLSGCISQGHLHSLQQTSVKSTELGNESGGFESKQQQHKQVVHKAQEVRQQQTLPNQQQPVPYLSSVQHPHAVYQRQQQVSDLMPTPPPPLPPSGSTLHQFHLNQDHQHHQRQILMSNDNQQRVAPEAIFGMLSNNSQLLQQSKQSHSNQRARLVGAQESSYWSVTPGSSMEPNIGSTINTINNNSNTLNFNQPSGQINSSNQIGYHVVETGEQQGLSRAQPVHNQFHLVASSSNPNHLQQSRVIQYMPRSRSTDHRLCSHLREQIYMDRSQQQVAAAHELQQQPQVLNRSHVPPTLLRALPVQRTLINQSHLGAQQHHTIGRALGQAYMQRLQRQPTIYSLGANIQRPSRSVHRGTNEHHQQQQPYLPGDLVHQLSVNHQMPRSRSQSSLDRRPRLNTGAAADCQQCNYSAIHRTTSRIQLAQLADTDCSFGATRTQCPGNQSCAQTGGAGSFRYNSTDSKTCCAGNSGCSSDTCRLTAERCDESRNCTRGGPMDHREGVGSGRCGKHSSSTSQSRQPAPLTNLGLMKLISDVDKAIQNAMFIAQHIDNLDEFESVKENWKYIAMVIDRIFLIVFLIACIGGTVAIFGMVPWENYTVAKPIDLQLTRLMALNLTGTGEQYSRSCRDF